MTSAPKKTDPVLQVALDFVDLSRAIKVAKAAIAGGMTAFDKLRVVVSEKGKPRTFPMAHMSAAERKKMMEKLLLLRTGKLKTRGKEELFRKLKITAKARKGKTTGKKGEAQK